MVNGFKVITLCGSTRFKDEFLEAQKRLTLEGNVVISVGLFGHSGDKEVWTDGVKDMLDRQHLAKIAPVTLFSHNRANFFMFFLRKRLSRQQRSEVFDSHLSLHPSHIFS